MADGGVSVLQQQQQLPSTTFGEIEQNWKILSIGWGTRGVRRLCSHFWMDDFIQIAIEGGPGRVGGQLHLCMSICFNNAISIGVTVTRCRQYVNLGRTG